MAVSAPIVFGWGCDCRAPLDLGKMANLVAVVACLGVCWTLDYILLGVVWLHIQDRWGVGCEICHHVAFAGQQLIPRTVWLNLHAVSWLLLVPGIC